MKAAELRKKMTTYGEGEITVKTKSGATGNIEFTEGSYSFIKHKGKSCIDTGRYVIPTTMVMEVTSY